jgi:hypothetical protein
MSLTGPTRRVILLGASNLVRSLSTVVETARLVWQEPIEIMAAIGHGRSYGKDSTVCGRKISGIFPCPLWNELERRPQLPTAALVTDIGNDLVYEVPVERLLEWVEGCLDRLAAAGAATIITQLPTGSLARLGECRFLLYRQLLFPRYAISLAETRRRATELNQSLLEIGRQRKISVIPVSDAWYGMDPIHLKRATWRRAWPTILSTWRGDDPTAIAPRASLMRWAYLRCLAPSERTVFGWRRHCEQPCGRLSDGTTVSLY